MCLVIKIWLLPVLCLAESSKTKNTETGSETYQVAGIVQYPSSIRIPGRWARYIKISLPRETWLHLAEVEVIGRFPGEINNRNLALDRPTRQSSTADFGKAGSWLAVDGSADGLYSNGSVSHTNLENSPWWEVDLGEVCKIEAIRVFNRTDGVEDRLHDVQISATKHTEPQPRWGQKPGDRSPQAHLLPRPPLLLSSVPLRVLSWMVLLSVGVFMVRSLWRQVGVRKLFLCHGFLILLAIALAIILKINRKFDSLPIIASTGASIALSKYNYGLEGYKAFLDYTAGPLNYGLLQSAGDFTKGVRKCVDLSDPRLTPAPDPEGLKVMALYYRDKYGFMPGYSPAISDYYALAFLLFGYSWPATFCLYFFLLSVSALLFFYSFQNYPPLLALLTSSLGGYVCLVTYMFYLGLALQDTRTISCLAVLPAMHLMSFIFAGKQWKGGVVLSTLAQLALLLIIMRIRHSAVWFSLALALGG